MKNKFISIISPQYGTAGTDLNYYKIAHNLSSKGHKINIETGLYFGKKNIFTENQNLFISGVTQFDDQNIEWEFIKIT